MKDKPVYYIESNEDCDEVINILKQIPGHTFQFNGHYFQFDSEDYLKQCLELHGIKPRLCEGLKSLYII